LRRTIAIHLSVNICWHCSNYMLCIYTAYDYALSRCRRISSAHCSYSACVYNCVSFVELPSVDGVKIIIVNFITDKSRFYRVYCRSTITAALSRSPQSTLGSLLSSTPSDDASCCCCCSLSSPVDDDGD